MSGTRPVPASRLRALNPVPDRPDGDFVLYWMVAARRLEWSHALDRAIEHATRLGKPLLVLEAVSAGYPWASDRHHRALLDAMWEHRGRLRGGPVGHFAYVEPAPGEGRGLLRTLADRACILVTDDSPAFHTPVLLEAAADVRCRAEAVDGCGLLPFRSAGRSFGTAHHFRRHLQNELPAHLGDAPTADPLPGTALVALPGLPEDVVSRWPPASDALLSGELGLGRLPIDHSVRPTGWKGGGGAARTHLRGFLERRLEHYAEHRNDPDSDASSRLSPWLHYGNVSVHEIFAEVCRSESWTPARLSHLVDGRRSGWWGMSESAESFLDELVTWRELGFGFCAHEHDFDRFESLPGWALESLEAHADDPREHVYSLERFEAAETHDELWNAAQRQLVSEGVIHNYLRMLWGKKILEWTEHPRHALDVMVELNNRYALDGRDPNSYSGIMWTLGRFDRGWPERPIYGKVRSMSSAATRRKVSVSRYLDRWGERSGLAPTPTSA